MFNNVFQNKKVFITGHTGFKGSWLSCWLIKLGADVTGYSKDIPTQPSMFESLELADKLKHIQGDIRDIDKMREALVTCQPDFVFHMAAQPIVSESYAEPLETITSNVVGTANVLDCLKDVSHACTAVIITSDKCYENVEWLWGYRESDRLGGKDIYSASKGAAELMFHAYFQSFLNKKSDVLKVATARAGNVIGGGDWAKDRIVADCVRAWSQEQSVDIRCPKATRPWQHVLEPLSGYLTLAMKLNQSDSLNGEQFNFGPKAEQNNDVATLIKDLAHKWKLPNTVSAFNVVDEVPFNEAGLLKLDCDKAASLLKWQPTMNYGECVDTVSDWYREFYAKRQNMLDLTFEQIGAYEKLASERGIEWTE